MSVHTVINGRVSIGVDALSGDIDDVLAAVRAAHDLAAVDGVVSIELSPPTISREISLPAMAAWSTLLAEQVSIAHTSPVAVWWTVTSWTATVHCQAAGR